MGRCGRYGAPRVGGDAGEMARWHRDGISRVEMQARCRGDAREICCGGTEMVSPAWRCSRESSSSSRVKGSRALGAPRVRVRGRVRVGGRVRLKG